MIANPLNDYECLSAITDQVRERVQKRDPAFVALAEQVGTTEGLIEHLQAKPQRNDEGEPTDGPRTASCAPSQRVRLSPIPEDPNCVERAAIFLGVSELIDPSPVRQLKTTMTPFGLHTFPVENRTSVGLDPQIPRNALNGDLFETLSTGVTFTTLEAIDWLVSIAEEPAAAAPGGLERVAAAHHAMYAMLNGATLDDRSLDDVAYTCALALNQAHYFGHAGRALIRETLRAIGARLNRYAAPIVGPAHPAPEMRNALSLQIGPYNIKPNWDVLGAVGRVGARLGTDVALLALQTKLAGLGLTPPAMSALEHEFNREGISLGPLAPRVPSLAALSLLPSLSSLRSTTKASTAPNASTEKAATNVTNTASGSLSAPQTATAVRNALGKPDVTQVEMLREMERARVEINALGGDIRSSFRSPFSKQLFKARQVFEREYGRPPGTTGSDLPKLHDLMNPVPSSADIRAQSYQGDFVSSWDAFEREFALWLTSDQGMGSRFWYSAHATAVDFRARGRQFREKFLALGGLATPVPPESSPIPGKPASFFDDLFVDKKKTAMVMGGALAAALVLPPLLRR